MADETVAMEETPIGVQIFEGPILPKQDAEQLGGVPAATYQGRLDDLEGETASHESRVGTLEAANLPARVSAVETGQASGVYGYPDKATMDADLTPPDKAVGYVTNDPTAANNGTWRKSGASGTGNWVQGGYYLPPNSVSEETLQDSSVTKKKTAFGAVALKTRASLTFPDASTVNIDALRYVRNDGTFTDLTGISITGLTGNFDYLVGNGAGALTLTKGTLTYFWQDLPNLGPDQFILMYKNDGFWQSDLAEIQSAIDSAYQKNGTIRTADDFIFSDDGTVTVPVCRLAKGDGTSLVSSQTVLACSGANDYICIDGSAGSLVVSKGLKADYWEELPFLHADRFILMAKRDGGWTSQHPSIQDAIHRASYHTPRIRIDLHQADGLKISGDDVIITGIRGVKDHGPGKAGTFLDLTANPSTISCPGDYDYLIADCTADGDPGGNVIIKGTKTYYWQEFPDLGAYKTILMAKDSGIWTSQHPAIQAAIHRSLYHPAQVAPVTVEKVVKQGGTIGVDCDYTDIKAAVDAITDNSSQKRYVLRVLDGFYDYSDSVFDFIPIKNWVQIIGRSRKTVQVVRRETVYDDGRACFDARLDGNNVEYAALQNMTIISDGCKTPVHIDGTDIIDGGTVDVIDCDLINELPSGHSNYRNCLALGLRPGQRVRCFGVYANGHLWAHNSKVDDSSSGCAFELYNCIATGAQVGDLVSYGKDRFIMEGCEIDYLTFRYYKDYPAAGDPHLRAYVCPSWSFEMRGNNIGYIEAVTFYDGGGAIGNPDAMALLYDGKWGITEPSIHNYCKNNGAGTIEKGGLVALDPDTDMKGVVAWTAGARLYGVAMESITTGSFGVVQHSGVVSLLAAGPIAFDGDLELNAAGEAVPQSSGIKIGSARGTIVGATTETIQIKLAQ